MVRPDRVHARRSPRWRSVVFLFATASSHSGGEGITGVATQARVGVAVNLLGEFAPHV